LPAEVTIDHYIRRCMCVRGNSLQNENRLVESGDLSVLFVTLSFQLSEIGLISRITYDRFVRDMWRYANVF